MRHGGGTGGVGRGTGDTDNQAGEEEEEAGLLAFSLDLRFKLRCNWQKGGREMGLGTDLGACASLLGLAPAASSFAVGPVVALAAPLALTRPRTAESAIGFATVGEEEGAVVGLLGVAEEWE